MELAAAALSILLPKLGTLLGGQYKLHKGVRGEIKFLQVEMESMQAVLIMLSELPPNQISYLDKIWVRNLKELSYDIEDSIDTFMVRIDAPVSAKPHSFRKFFDRTIGLMTKAKTRHHIANDIEDIKKRIREVAERRDRYKFEDVAARTYTTTLDPRVLASFEHASKLVGTDVPVKKITNMLTKEKGELMVVSIVGVGGLGKTTIANLVYERFGGQFECQAFVSVSLQPNMKKILSSILRQVSKGKCTNVGEVESDELIRSIRQFLKDQRYFIVIDDVWSEEAWKTIEGALIDNNLGSKVIVTTRNVDVAKFSSSVGGVMYELEPLSHKDSEILLSKRIFNEEEGIMNELKDVAMKILKKCGGIPLAIVTIASMLASIKNKSKYEWYGVYKSMGSGLENDKSLGNMREILHLSYSDLPPYLKPCLLHLSMFPEDSTIPKNELIRLWVAEGFVGRDRGSNLYGIGERYFNELVNRSMIQPVDMDDFDSVTTCRVHDMILDLIISLSAEEYFVTISDSPQLISPAGKIRRLSLQGSVVDSSEEEDSKDHKMILPRTANTSHVRTLIALGDAFRWMPPLSSFPALRVLILEYFPSKNNTLKGLGSLYHLRYLELRGVVEAEILEEIGNLRHLKTLDLHRTMIQELPASIVQLRQLEHLITKEQVKFPDGIGNLVFLQQLEVLDVTISPHTLAELGNLVGLRVLTISGLAGNDKSCVKTFLQVLSNLHNIHTLSIRGDDDMLLSLDCMKDQWSGPAQVQCFYGLTVSIYKLPRWFSSLSELSCLSINLEMLRQDDLQLLGALPVLQFLYLKVDTTEERLVIGPDQPFRSLTDFKFHTERLSMVFAQRAMQKLQRLELRCHVTKKEGASFDVGLENLTSLKQVTIKLKDTEAREVKDAETKVRDKIDRLPNHPTVTVLSEFSWDYFFSMDEGMMDIQQDSDSYSLGIDEESYNDC